MRRTAPRSCVTEGVAAFVAALLSCLPLAGAQTLTDVSASFTVARSGLVLNRSSGTFDSMVTLRNNGNANVYAPLRLVVTIAPATVTLVNKTSATPVGLPYIELGLLDGFAAPQEQFRQKLAFSNPSRVTFTYKLQVMAATTVGSMVITITEPTNGAPLVNSRTLAAGTVNGPVGTGVTVNGKPACALGGKFFVNDLPVTPDLPAITATARSPQGSTAQTTVTTSPSYLLTDFRIIADSPCGGVAPLRASFHAHTEIPVSEVRWLEIDFDGDGSIDTVLGDIMQPVQFTYVQPGLYRARFALRRTDGSATELFHLTQVTDVATAEQPFQQLLGNLRSALVAQNIVRALSYFTADAQMRYRPVLERIATELPSVANAWSQPQALSIGSELAEFAITRNVQETPYVFRVVFLKDGDGTWKIDSM